MPQRFKKYAGALGSVGGVRWSVTDYNVGDVVQTRDYKLQSLSRHTDYTIVRIEYENTYDNESIGGEWVPIYRQKLFFRGQERGYLAHNFKIIHKVPKEAAAMTIHAIEERKPVLSIEITVGADGKDEEVGEFSRHDTLSQARAVVGKTITASIREKNEYRRFRLYQMIEVGGAKEPEIEFK